MEDFSLPGKIDYHITESFLLPHIAGTAYPHQVGNILLVGISGGFMEAFLGFGTVSSIRSGILAARAIATNSPFDGLVKKLDQEMRRSVRIREALNTMRNADYDRLVSLGTLPIIKQINYNTNIPILNVAGSVLELVRKSVDLTEKSILPPSPKIS
ncbi:hypothetical protein N752_28455 [Desulforamulus aquiferis]|nr:hypothetical protein N752_28455 [Desulforamulus aquiferis]